MPVHEQAANAGLDFSSRLEVVAIAALMVLLVPSSSFEVVVLIAQRMLLWQRRNNTVYPFNETVQQVFARISALRDSLDGPPVSLLPLLWHAGTMNMFMLCWSPQDVHCKGG